ncbi:S-adenosyl-L-methionine-dependent methyltransferase [Emericellopsis atlantica]|uniref:tRNA wybutosine-synthesizing protein 2 n=1 Tax=Emericellopsis atlantica TaxID=2614577 RepID=A0A9P7ZRC6_9HYPO|nr:S-adenosyl-L-methionine-dependent methyltransferase [Emericellopsis atlantica]KAG9256416.1 S-adenosyl-L-methionine-dependent methyltransferase [Emericellopsis atlantica]
MAKKQTRTPVHSAITKWLETSHLQISPADAHELLSTAPKRFTIYEPMALLPAGSFLKHPWTLYLQDDLSKLWPLVLQELSKANGVKLTHLAITEGIPLHEDDDASSENVLRSPIGLRMLHGDFGPATSPAEPAQADYEKALWVSTRQNGIIQTWAPRWTMFSRGNVKEKARLLDFPRAENSDEWAVDLYAGIGYFVFSYASLGFRVLGWELNPWSVEGLRRGARANRWSVKIVQGQDLSLPLNAILSGDEQIIIFLEHNQKALERIQHMQQSLGVAKDLRHVNGGFLPTSEPVWKSALDMTHEAAETWLHLHENVGVKDIGARQEKIQQRYEDWTSSEPSPKRSARASHVEQVKTFAPGVWHCVFDIHITR